MCIRDSVRLAVAVLAHFESGVNALSDVGALRGDGRQHAAGVAVEPLAAVVEADLAHDLAHQLVEIDKGGGRDLAQEHDVAGLDGRLARHARRRVQR